MAIQKTVEIFRGHILESYLKVNGNGRKKPKRRRPYQKWQVFPFPDLDRVYCPLCKIDVVLGKFGYMNDWRVPDRYRCSRCLLVLRPNIYKYFVKLYSNLANL